MGLEVDAIEQVLREHICGLCDACAPDGSCGLDAPFSCPVNVRLPIVSRAIQGTNGQTPAETLAAIREALCAACPGSDSDDGCGLNGEASSLMVIEALLRPLHFNASRGRSDPRGLQQEVFLALNRALVILRDKSSE